MQQHLAPPEPDSTIQIGDYIEVLEGMHMGKHGVVTWFAKGDTSLWFQNILTTDNTESKDGLSTLSVPTAIIRRMNLTNTLQFTKDRGYDVRPGDVVTVTHGLEYEVKGVMQSADFPNACLTPVCDRDHSLTLTMLKLYDVATKYGMRLNGAMLKGRELVSFCTMRKRSYLTPPRQCTTPSVKKASSSSLTSSTAPNTSSSSMWSTWSGSAGGLNEFNIQDNNDALVEKIKDSTCPDPFCGKNGPMPEGCITAFCTSNGAGAAMKHYHIPTRYLSPAPP
ncbi:hypothetical protein F4604DRAFT_1684476 [Suillus subluteus]|nr:hypothetical protein F4604DRAFT_1684476 [Suillus subluteus]